MGPAGLAQPIFGADMIFKVAAIWQMLSPQSFLHMKILKPWVMDNIRVILNHSINDQKNLATC